MDKATSFGLPFFYRVVLPGTVLTALLYPFLDRFVRIFVDPLQAAAAWVGIAMFSGVSIAALDDPIYEVLEGRRLWPNWLYQWRRRRWQRYIDGLRERARCLPRTDWRFLETWDRLRRFPAESDGTPIATRPTRLGNILASSEDYSMRAYGLHAVAYWERLWLSASKDDRDEVDRSAAPADGFTYMTAVVFFVGAFYSVIAVVSASVAVIGPSMVLTPDEQVACGYAGLALMLAARVPYAVSIPGHARHGETIKAMFDVYQDRLRKIKVPASQADRDEAERIGGWLVYGYGATPPTPSARRPPRDWFGVLFGRR